MKPVLAQNQNSGSSQLCTIGSRNTPAMTRKMTPNTGQRELVALPRRVAGRDRARSAPATAKISGGHEVRAVLRRARAPSSRPETAASPSQLTVIMLAYSAMKNAANFMLLYSVWKPATSSFSASGRSNGTRLVSANAGDQENDEADDLRERAVKDVPAAGCCRACDLHQLRAG